MGADDREYGSRESGGVPGGGPNEAAGLGNRCISRGTVIRCGFGRRGSGVDEGAGGAGERRGEALLRMRRASENRSSIRAGGWSAAMCPRKNIGNAPSRKGCDHRRPFPPLFAPFTDFFVSHSRKRVSLFSVKSENRPVCHNPVENMLQNLPLQVSLDGRSPAPTGTSKSGRS